MDVGAQTSLSVFEWFFSFGERFGTGRKEVFVRARDGASLWLLLAPFLVGVEVYLWVLESLPGRRFPGGVYVQKGR